MMFSVRLCVALPPAAPRPGAPSWVAELEDDDPDQTSEQVRETHRAPSKLSADDQSAAHVV